MTKRASTFELVLPPRPVGVPAFHWMRDSLRQEIVTGGLTPGSKIPASRDLAQQYHLSRSTVLAALNDLEAEGYLRTRKGSGTYVSTVLPESLLQTHTWTHGQYPQHVLDAPSAVSAFAKRIPKFSHTVHRESRAFRTNLPALDLFPTTLWAQVAARRLRSATSRNLLGCGPAGYLPLRRAVAHYAHSSRGIHCDPEQVLIVSSIHEGLDLTARLLLDPGDRVLMEDPCYSGAHAILHAAGAQIAFAFLDTEGASPAEADFHNCRMFHVTPGHQYPTGITMSLSRRLQLLAWAATHNVTIFEDDFDSEFRFNGIPLPAMQGLDHAGRVIFCGSFNRVMFPSLRLAYLVLPPNFVDLFARAKSLTNHHSLLDQAILCDFIKQGHLGRHIRLMRKVYEERFLHLLDCAHRYLPEHLEIATIEAGLQTVGTLRNNLSADLVAQQAAHEGIDLVPISRYCHIASMPHSLQIGFAGVSSEDIEAGTRKLATILTRLNSSDDRSAARSF